MCPGNRAGLSNQPPILNPPPLPARCVESGTNPLLHAQQCSMVNRTKRNRRAVERCLDRPEQPQIHTDRVVSGRGVKPTLLRPRSSNQPPFGRACDRPTKRTCVPAVPPRSDRRSRAPVTVRTADRRVHPEGPELRVTNNGSAAARSAAHSLEESLPSSIPRLNQPERLCPCKAAWGGL